MEFAPSLLGLFSGASHPLPRPSPNQQAVRTPQTGGSHVPFLQFKGKTAVETYHHTVPHHTLEFDRKLSVLGKGEEPGLDGNLIIEGDNLLALKALLPTHAGRIKCIYIDPPYNTGNEGWVYNDNLTQPQFKEWIGQTVGKEEEDACRHDKWCCMMYPRLMLLKELLRDDGVLCVSIDDSEVSNLRQLLDEILGSANFVATVVWQKRTSPDARATLGAAHDYILMYARNREAFKDVLRSAPLPPERRADYRNPDNDPRGPWASVDMTGQTGHATPDQFYEVTTPGGTKLRPPEGRCWAYAEETFCRLIADNRVWFGKGGTARPRHKKFLSETEGCASWTWWPYEEYGHNQEATKELNAILGSDRFDSPKPVRLLKGLVALVTSGDDLVLDSFAGSGTTAHAVMELNKADGMKRQFVLVQQPYDSKAYEADHLNICEKIAVERVRRVMQGYAFTGNQTEVLLDEKVTLTALKNADDLLARMDAAKQANASRFDGITNECKDGVVRVLGTRAITGETAGLGGSFTYARLSPQPLFGEYRNLGEVLPAYEEIAKYVFYTETSQQGSPKGMDKKTGFIGAHAGRSYYLLYRPNAKADWALDIEFLRETAANDGNREIVVYCEKIWVHRGDRSDWEAQSGKRLRAMLVPFNLK